MNGYKCNKMKTILVILFLELVILEVQAEYNPNNSSEAKNLSEISDYLQKSQIPLTQMDVESQKKIIKEVANIKDIRNAKDLSLIINLSKLYHERIFKLFFTDKEFYQYLVILSQNVYKHSALISQQPEMAKHRDD